MNRHKLSIVLLALLMTALLFSCSNKTPTQTITSLEMEIPAGDVQLTENGYALFSGRTYSVSNDFAVRGYINNGQSYSYVNATVYAQKVLADGNKEKMGENFRFTTGDIYDVWAEYNGMKSNVIQVCAYEANVVFAAAFTVDTFKTTDTYLDLIKLVRNAWYFTESGAIKAVSGADVRGLNFCFINSNNLTEKTLSNDSAGEIGSKDYDYLFIYSDPTSPFAIVNQIKIYSETDFDAIALNTVRIDRANKSLAGLVYAKRYNGTTVQSGISPFTSGTTLKADHSITISDGIEAVTYNAGDNVNFEFVVGTQYTVKLTLTVGENTVSASKKITFTK